MNEETYLREELARITTRHRRMAQPYIDRLACIEAAKPPQPVMVLGDRISRLAEHPDGLLCVGGPLDGQRRNNGGSAFRAPVRPRMTAMEAARQLAVGDETPLTEKVEHVIYRRQTLFGSVTIWAVDGMSPGEVVARLVENYRSL